MSRKSSSRWLRRPFVLLPVLAVAVGVPLTLLIRGGGGDAESTQRDVLVLGVLAILAVLAIAQIVRMLAGVDPDVPALAERLVAEPAQQRLLARWLSRARWARDVGGFCGVLVWVLGTQMSGDILVWGVGGIAVGAMAAELHHVKAAKGPRTATLDVRSIGDYLPDVDRRRMIGVGLVSGLVALAGLGSDDGRSAAWVGIGALAVLGAAWAVQWRVATRPRPAIPEALRRADDLARGLAIGRGLALPATFFALALIARGFWVLSPGTDDIGGLIAVITWLYALRLWWTNRRLGLDSLLRQPKPAVA